MPVVLVFSTLFRTSSQIEHRPLLPATGLISKDGMDSTLLGVSADSDNTCEYSELSYR